MARTAFDRFYGSEQGRCRVDPAAFSPGAGVFSFVLGSTDPAQMETLNVGDGVVLSQAFDTTGVKAVSFRAKVRAPATAGRSWRFSWGVDALVRGYRDLVPGKFVDMATNVIDVSQLTPGVHTLKLTLELVS